MNSSGCWTEPFNSFTRLINLFIAINLTFFVERKMSFVRAVQFIVWSAFFDNTFTSQKCRSHKDKMWWTNPRKSYSFFFFLIWIHCEVYYAFDFQITHTKTKNKSHLQNDSSRVRGSNVSVPFVWRPTKEIIAPKSVRNSHNKRKTVSMMAKTVATMVQQ